MIGCASVEPAPDFDRACSLIAERTGVDDVYTPATQELIEGKVNDLLTDGLTTEEAISMALLNNRSFQALFQQIGASRADIVQSQLLSNPSIALLGRFPEGGGRTNLTFGFGQELVDLWQIPVRKKIAESQLEQTILTIAQRAVELAAKVKQSCYQVLAMQRAERIAKENLDLVEQSLKLAKDRFSAGEIGLVDVDLALSDLLSVQRELVSIQREQDIAKAGLGRLLGLSRFKSNWTLIDELPERTVIADDHTLILRAMRQRLDARMAALQVQEAEEELSRQYLNIVPSVVVGAELERTENRALPGRKIAADAVRESIGNGQPTVPTIQSRAERKLEQRQIIDTLLGPSLEITLPIWDQNQAQIAKSQFLATEKRKEYEDLLDVVAQEVQQAAAAVRGNEQLTVLSEEKILPQARKSVGTARRAYEAGEYSIITLIEAQRFLIDQQKNYVNDLRDYAAALVDLERAVGGPPPNPNTCTVSSTTQPAKEPHDEGSKQ